MKIKILGLGLVFMIFFGCAIPMINKIDIYPDTPDYLYSQMIPTLLEMGFEIIETDKSSLIIIAGKTKTLAYYRVTINFIKKNRETSVFTHVILPGKTSDNLGWTKKMAEEIINKFEERIKK